MGKEERAGDVVGETGSWARWLGVRERGGGKPSRGRGLGEGARLGACRGVASGRGVASRSGRGPGAGRWALRLLPRPPLAPRRRTGAEAPPGAGRARSSPAARPALGRRDALDPLTLEALPRGVRAR